jgi:nucleoid-associated protein YgaU
VVIAASPEFMLATVVLGTDLAVKGVITGNKKGTVMNNIFYIIGVIVVVLFILSYFGFR